ncbi:MAG: ribosome-associated translation inhibitor RaiA [Hyphomonadaceae bacterium]|nr:ribosome-associated translation inhibitor RaiA [Hyphomonadaceae bacterium]
MRIQVAGRQMDVGEALRTRIEDELASGVGKYFNRATDAVVTVGRNGGGASVEVDCTVHLASGISLQAEGHGGDAHSAFGDAMGKLEKRVRRYKRRLRNHHADHKSPLPAEDASAYVLAPLQDESEADAGASVESAPLVIAETRVPVRTMTVSTAVMQLDLSENPALLFRNAAHGGLNLVYRRADGNIGWVDPDRVKGAS